MNLPSLYTAEYESSVDVDIPLTYRNKQKATVLMFVVRLADL